MMHKRRPVRFYTRGVVVEGVLRRELARGECYAQRLRRRAKVSQVSIAVVFSGLLGCSSDYSQTGQKEMQGSQVGSIVGSVVGAYVPGGGSVAGQVLRSQAGTIGGLVGGAIGAALDEEDRRTLAQTTRAALASGQPKTFSNKQTGVRGSVTVTSTRVDLVAISVAP